MIEITISILTSLCLIMGFAHYMNWVRSHFRKKEEKRMKEREAERTLERLVEKVERLEKDRKC